MSVMIDSDEILRQIQYFFRNLFGNIGRTEAIGIGGAVAAVLLVLLLVCGVFSLAYYFFKRYGLYKLCLYAGIPNPGLVFVPFAIYYYRGLLTERSRQASTGKHWPFALVCLICRIVQWLLGVGGIWSLAALLGFAAPAASALLAVFLLVMRFICLYWIFEDYSPDNSVLFTILCAIPIAEPVIMLVINRTVPVSVAGRLNGGQPRYNNNR